MPIDQTETFPPCRFYFIYLVFFVLPFPDACMPHAYNNNNDWDGRNSSALLSTQGTENEFHAKIFVFNCYWHDRDVLISPERMRIHAHERKNDSSRRTARCQLIQFVYVQMEYMRGKSE